MRARLLVLLALGGCGARSSLADLDAAVATEAGVEETASDAGCSPPVTMPDPSPPSHARCSGDIWGFERRFVLKDASFCLVAHYEFASTPQGRLTWGRHGGPLEGPRMGEPWALRRWSVPRAMSGVLSEKSESIDTTLPKDTWLPYATDLPFGGWTAVGISQCCSPPAGELLLLRDAHVDRRLSLHPLGSVVGLARGGRTRLLYEDVGESGGRQQAMVVAVDDCERASCGPPTTVDFLRMLPMGQSLGVFADPMGNVFAAIIEPRGAPGTFLRIFGFPGSNIAPGVCPSAGVSVEAAGALLPAADGERIFMGNGFFEQGIDVLTYRVDAAGMLRFEKGGSFIEAPSARGFYAAFLDASSQLWLVERDSPDAWVLGRR